MAASLHHALLPPPSLQSRAAPIVNAFPVLVHQHHKLCSRPPMASLRFPRSPKLRCASNGALGAEALQRYKVLDESDTDVDEMDDLERQVNEFFVGVMSMLEAGNKDDAIDLLQANYEAVKEQMDNGCKDIEQAAILDIVALGYMVVGDLKLVEHLLKMLNEIVVGLDDSKPILDSILMHMGSMYTTLGKFEDAMHVYERGLNILEKEVGNHSSTLITPLMGMAKVSRLCKRATNSVALYDRTINIMQRNRGPESEELLVPLFSLGNLFISEGKAADAETCFSRILSICTNAYGEKDGRVGMAMCTLARALFAKGEALDCLVSIQTGLGRNDHNLLANLQRIMSIQEKEFGSESKEVMETLKEDYFLYG